MRLVKTLLSLPALITAACSGGADSSTTSRPASEEVPTHSASTGANTANTSTADASATATSTSATGADTVAGGTETSASTATVTGGTTGSTPSGESLSFARDIFPLWEMVREPAWQYRGSGSYSGCNVDGVCHGGARAGAGLMMLDAPSTYAELVDVPSASTLCAGTLRVVVGDPDNSCLVLFYKGRLGKDDLDWVNDAEIELMRDWIRQGALP